MMTAGPILVICRQQLHQQPESEVAKGCSGANGAASKPTQALHLWREVFQVEHFKLVTDLGAPACLVHQPGKPLLRRGNSMLAFGELCLRSPKQEFDPATLGAGLEFCATRSYDGDACRCPKTPTRLLLISTR